MVANNKNVNTKTTNTNMKMSKEEIKSCERLLSSCEMFMKLPANQISELAKQMTKRVVAKDEKFIYQGLPVDRFSLLEHGDIKRKYVDEHGRSHNVEFAIKAQSINSMRVISGEPSLSTVSCTSDNGCKVYEMSRNKFLQILERKPQLSKSIMEGLCEQLRIGSKKYATPLLEQQNKEDVNVPAVSIAAGIESYYRSALNSMLNTRLTGIKSELFPNMHIQVPTRIAYIIGFKALRATLDKNVEPETLASNNANAVRLAVTISPGIFMTPISSLLEASNAGHMNSEPIQKRWMRGILPRCGREIIFGIGLNQMSDYFEERFQSSLGQNKSPLLANAMGSLAAGVVSGYFSHIPHNLSTYKLLEPHRSYHDLYTSFVDKSVPPIVNDVVKTWPSPIAQNMTRTIFATLFPRGLVVRTAQIVGSFMILNGTINYLHLREQDRIQRAIG